MFKKVSLVAFAAAAVLASCITSPGEKPVDYSTPGDPAVISLKVDNYQPTSRAGVDNNLSDDDAVINDFIVFIVRADDNTFDISPRAYSSTDLNAGVLSPFRATDKASKIYIVANTGTYAGGPFASCTNMAQVKATVIAIDDPNHGCSDKDVWMSGSANLTKNGTAKDPINNTDDVDKLEATLKLYFVPAKIYIQVDNMMKNYSAVGKTYAQGATIVNGGGLGTMFGVGARSIYGDADKYYYNGIDLAYLNGYFDKPADYPAVNTVDYVHKTAYAYQTGFSSTGNFHTVKYASPAKPAGPGFTRPDATTGTYTSETPITDAMGFYVMPAATNGPKIWAAAYGKHNPDIPVNDAEGLSNAAHYAAAKDWYWGVAFGKQGGAFANPIVAGNKYIATITIVGDAGIGSGGTTDPTEETNNSAVYLNVQTAAWISMIYGNQVFE